MTTQEIKCILTLAETLNFSRAARELNITQPAFSRMIVRVEEELGFKLFLRNTRAVKISQEGDAFIEALKQSYTIYESGVEYARSMLRKENSLDIACSPDFVFHNLPPYIIQFKKRHPQVFVQFAPTTTEKILERLRCNYADIGFIFTDRVRFSSDFERRVLKVIPLHLVMCTENPLSQKDVVLPADLKQEKIIVHQSNAGAYELATYGAPLLMINRKFELHLKESQVALTTQECLLRVACNQGICFLPPTIDYLLPPNCVMRRIDGVDFNLTALWNRGKLSKWAKAFLDGIGTDPEARTG